MGSTGSAPPMPLAMPLWSQHAGTPYRLLSHFHSLGPPRPGGSRGDLSNNYKESSNEESIWQRKQNKTKTTKKKETTQSTCMPEKDRRALDRESLVYRQLRVIRYPPRTATISHFHPKAYNLLHTTPYSQRFRSQSTLLGESLGRSNQRGSKISRLATVNPGATSI